MKKIKKLLHSLSLSDNNDDKENESEENDNDDDDDNNDITPTLLSIGENKNALILSVRFHPDAFFANDIKLYDEPPLKLSNDTDDTDDTDDNNKYNVYSLLLKQYSPKISFNITISPKLCELGYVRVNKMEFFNQIQRFIPICLSLSTNTKRDNLYIPMTVKLPVIQQRHGIFDDLLTPTLMIIPNNPKLYRYKLTESFLWRYQYVRIRENTSLKMDVIGEIPCDLSFEIIGYPVSAISSQFFLNNNHQNIIDKDLNERKSIVDISKWSVFENSHWIKIQPSILKKLPLMRRCIDDLNAYIQIEKENNDNIKDRDFYNDYFCDKGYVIQQYLGHTVLECIGPINITENREYEIPISFDTNNNLFVEQTNNKYLFDNFPSELIAHIISYCDFEFVRNVLCCVSKQFYISSSLPSCYHTAIIPSTFLHGMLEKKTLSKMLISLNKCKRIDIYSLICEDNINGTITTTTNNINDIELNKLNIRNRSDISGECNIEELHLEFVTKTSLHIALFNIFDFNDSLRILKLTQCDSISNFALSLLPNNLEQLCLMNTLLNVESWSNLKSLKSLIITKSHNLHSIENNSNFLENIASTLPSQILESLCIWDGEEENKLIIKKLIENHNEVLNVFGIGGRICLYQPFSSIFVASDSLAFPRLEIMTVSCLSTNEITALIKEFGHQLRILEMYCPFVMEEELDIYQWLLNETNIDLFCGSLNKLEILMCQAFPHHMKRYMMHNKWIHLRQQFQQKFWKYRNKKNNNYNNNNKNIDKSLIPLILFDFGMDLNKIPLWIKSDIRKYLIYNQKRLELNFGEGI